MYMLSFSFSHLDGSVKVLTWRRTDSATTWLIWIYLDTLDMWLYLVECTLLRAVHDCFTVACTAKHHARHIADLARRLRSDCQSRSEIRHVWLCRSATYHVITRRHSFAVAAPRVKQFSCRRLFVALTLLTLSNANWKQFYFHRLLFFCILDFAYC